MAKRITARMIADAAIIYTKAYDLWMEAENDDDVSTEHYNALGQDTIALDDALRDLCREYQAQEEVVPRG